jgi:CHASE3 domain sensor protein
MASSSITFMRKVTMTITKRLILTLSLALLALIFVGVTGLTQLSRAQQRLDMVQTRLIPSIAGLNLAKSALVDSRLAGYRLSVFSNLADKTALDKAYNDAHAKFDEILNNYEKSNIFDETDRKMLDADRANMAAYRQALIPFVAAAHAGDMDAVRATLLAGTPLALSAAAVKKGFDDHIEYNNKLIANVREESIAAYNLAFRMMVSVIILGLLVTGALAWQLYVIINRRHHQRDRRHRLPDQHPGAERRRGSGARRRAGPRLRRGGDRGAQPGATQRAGRQGDQDADRRLGGAGGGRHPLVDAAGRTMQDIVASVARSASSSPRSPPPARSRAAASSRSAPAVTQMDQVVQQNASLVEEAAAALPQRRRNSSPAPPPPPAASGKSSDPGIGYGPRAAGFSSPRYNPEPTRHPCRGAFLLEGGDGA